MMLAIFGFIIIAYLFGSIPFGYLVVKAKKGIDIRTVGSGATGGTNAGRILGRNWGVFVGALDMLKGALPVFLTLKFLPQDPALGDWPLCFVIFAAVLGHIYPIFLNFKGGKGVSTTIGGLIPIFTWKIILFVVLLMFSIIKISKISSFASLNFALLLPLFLYLVSGKIEYLVLGTFLFIIIWWVHRENIQRLIEGKEKKSGLV